MRAIGVIKDPAVLTKFVATTWIHNLPGDPRRAAHETLAQSTDLSTQGVDWGKRQSRS